jgi:hypothetical protein
VIIGCLDQGRIAIGDFLGRYCSRTFNQAFQCISNRIDKFSPVYNVMYKCLGAVYCKYFSVKKNLKSCRTAPI